MVRVAWAACWHQGWAAGKGAGGGLGPLGVTGKRGPVQPQTGCRHTQPPPRNFPLQTEKSEYPRHRSQGCNLLAIALPPGWRAVPRLAAFSFSGRAGPGLRHSSERSQGVKELFCRPAECSRAGTSHTGALRPRSTGCSEGRSPPPEAGGTCRLYCLLENPNALSVSESLRRDLLPWFSQPFPVTPPSKLSS